MRDGRVALSVLASLVLGSFSRLACAQVHWDVGLGTGITSRALVGGSATAGGGPMASLEGNVAMTPFLRAGMYANTDFVPLSSDRATLQTISLGLQGKLETKPFLGNMPKNWRLALIVGFGFSSMREMKNDAPDGRRTLSGILFEVPLAWQATYKLAPPLFLFFRLGIRFGVGGSGDLFSGTSYTRNDGSQARFPSIGSDTVNPLLLVGLELDR